MDRGAGCAAVCGAKESATTERRHLLSLFALPGARSPSLGLAHRSVFSQTVFRYRPSSQASRCHGGCSPHPCSNPMPGSPITLVQP